MKSLAYVASAVILGVFVMLAPFIAVPPPSTSTEGNSYEAPASPQRALQGLEGLDKAVERSESAAGVFPNTPVDFISVCLVFLFSSVFALCVSFLFKRSVLFLRNRNLRSNA